MNFNILNNNDVIVGLIVLSGQYGFSYDESGIKTTVLLNDNDKHSVTIDFKNGQLSVTASELCQVFWALKEFTDEFSGKSLPESFSKSFTPKFKDLTYMLDCSRNAVYKKDVIKTVISQLAVSGYTSFMLYTEDTYVVKEYPYFGYLRNPFTRDDIKEIDAYAKKLGIELIPCIQTLGHFERIVRYPSMQNLFDFQDILMVGEEETYKFIEAMISACAHAFSSKKIHIGMDEAYMLGRGKYLDKNGYRTRFDIMKDHLQRVLEICKKYGYEPMIWSDMFFSLTLSDQYGASSDNSAIADTVPPEIQLVYWDYYHTNEAHYNEMISKHRVFKNKLGFATGAWKWLGFTPDNRYSFVSMRESAKACQKNGITDYIVTGWGDNGAESSCFSVMPAVFYAGYFNYHDYDMDKRFESAFRSFSSGVSFKDFMTVDLANRITTNDDVEEKNTANKYLLYNDVLLGTLDTIIVEGQGALYKKHAKALHSAAERAGKWTYIFKTQETLCDVLEIKAELGIKLRKAYKAGDRRALKSLLSDMKRLLKRIEVFYKTFRAQWNAEAQPNGFDVEDVRIGALKQRITVAIEKVSDYLSGKAAAIPELAEDLLCFMGGGTVYEKDLDQCEYRFFRITSVNVNN